MRTFFRYFAALFFIVAGVNHFRDPGIYRDMMPPWLPWHEALIAVSGAAEILGGLGLVPRFSRKAAAWGLIALLVALFPANVYLACNGWPGTDIPTWALWARLPLQPLMMLWVYLTSLRSPVSLHEVQDVLYNQEDLSKSPSKLKNWAAFFRE